MPECSTSGYIQWTPGITGHTGKPAVLSISVKLLAENDYLKVIVYLIHTERVCPKLVSAKASASTKVERAEHTLFAQANEKLYGSIILREQKSQVNSVKYLSR